MNRQLSALVLGLLFMVPAGMAQDGVTSENNERLKRGLERFPEADADKDGVLTMAEALAFRAAQRGGKKRGQAGRDPKKAGMRPAPVTTVSGRKVPAGAEFQGYNALFMGHSFFKPAAQHLLQVIPDTRVVDHTACIVFAGGVGGAPKTLWERDNSRLPGLARLDTGKVDFMAMTYYSPDNSAVADYARWFDYAVAKNPKVTFMVAMPWGKELYRASDERLAMADGQARQFYNTTIQPLRQKYPDNKVIYCPYGFGVYELIDRYKKEALPGVKHLCTRTASRPRTARPSIFSTTRSGTAASWSRN